MNFFEKDKRTALEAIEEAQRIVFAPVMFQATRILRDSGILKEVSQNRGGISLDDLATKIVDMSAYGVRVLAEAALGIGLLTEREGKYFITKTGFFILNDQLTRVNMDFVQDICYKGMYHLEDSIRNGKPDGLKEIGPWATIYEGLSKMPKNIAESWFTFDHYYSDAAFPEVLPLVFEKAPKTLLDIGGNTGKFTMQCFKYNPDVKITIMDLQGQLNMAQKNIDELGFGNRFTPFACNILDESQAFPKGFDAVWMSQFLDCFSDDEIVSILKRCLPALSSDGNVYILETFWDRQKFEASAFALQQTSLYFTAMANGNSQMYDSRIFIKLIEKAGLKVVEQKDFVGLSHTLLVCKPA
jgi:ubiquinone/menaquinone biosynthesis C-methylase UbiE